MVTTQRQEVSAKTIALIFSLKKRGASVRDIEQETGISKSSVARLLSGPEPIAKSPEVEEADLQAAIRKLLKKAPGSAGNLADAIGCSRKRVTASIKEMIFRGSMITKTPSGVYDITPAFAAAPGKAEVIAPKSGHGDGEFTHVFGAIGDTHQCNKHSRQDVMDAAYDTFERMGITKVYHTGNWIDGEARFNKTELVTAPGLDNQLNYMIDKYPQREGITTHYVAGDDHEGWYQQREGIEVGRYLQHKAEEAGRHDLKYLGYGEADIALRHGTGTAVMRVVHPGGGSSYAISYTDQKRVESYQGGEKPHIELAGHYHKAGYFYPREVHCVQTACCEDQTMFMRKKKLQAHVGYWVIKIAQDSNGAVTRFAPEFFPFYDRKYYRKDF